MATKKTTKPAVKKSSGGSKAKGRVSPNVPRAGLSKRGKKLCGGGKLR